MITLAPLWPIIRVQYEIIFTIQAELLFIKCCGFSVSAERGHDKCTVPAAISCLGYTRWL